MKMLKVLLVGVMLVVAAGVGGCCSGGSEAKSETKNVSTTLGTELQDLKDAYDKGIISEKEYKSAREKILKQRTKSD